MNRKILSFCAASAVALSASPAMALDYVFGFSGGTPWTLNINGNDFTSVDTGWIKSTGEHSTVNDNYLTGIGLGGGNYNNWGVFDLSSLTGPVTSAVLSLNTFGVTGTSTFYTLFDTSASLASLDADRGFADAAGIALFNDLGSGISYGGRLYSGADGYQVRSITLNGAALSAIQSAAGHQFALGGTLSPSQSGAVPEPATWGMMLLGFGIMGAFMRRKPLVTTRLSYN